MKLQLSSGQGPAECELAVGKLLRSLKQEFSDIEVIEVMPGCKADCIRSAIMRSQTDISYLVGTVQWICQSPYRPKHKRKNWFIDVSACEDSRAIEYDRKHVRIETFRARGKGGQHVNKVETGVRAIHMPTGIAVVSTDARSQHLNRQLALNRLCDEIAKQNQADAQAIQTLHRMEHLRLERGNAVRIYEGMDFKRWQ